MQVSNNKREAQTTLYEDLPFVEDQDVAVRDSKTATYTIAGPKDYVVATTQVSTSPQSSARTEPRRHFRVAELRNMTAVRRQSELNVDTSTNFCPAVTSLHEVKEKLRFPGGSVVLSPDLQQ